MKLDRLAAATAAAALFAASSAWSGPVLAPKPELSGQNMPIEQARWRHHHHHHHHHYWYPSCEMDEYANVNVATQALFWPAWGNDYCLFGEDCGYNVVSSPGCYFYGCSYGWTLGPFAWGLFGLGFYDPYGIFGLAYTYPLEAGINYAALGVNVGAFAAGVGARPIAARALAGRHIDRGGYRGHYAGVGPRHLTYRGHGFRHYGHYGGFRHFHGGHHFMAYRGGHGFHGGGFHGFHGGGFHGGGFHGGGFHGGGHGRH